MTKIHKLESHIDLKKNLINNYWYNCLIFKGAATKKYVSIMSLLNINYLTEHFSDY